MKVKIVLTMVAVFVLAGALIVWGGAGASVAQAQEPEPTPAPTEPPPPPPEEPQPPHDRSKSETSSGPLSPSPDKADLTADVPAAVPAGWQMNFKFVAGTAFHPRNSTMTWGYGYGGCTYATANQYDLMAADFQLPEGAVVDLVRMFYYDTNAADSDMFLSIYDGAGGTSDPAQAHSSGTGGYGSNADTGFEYTVANYDYSMTIQWRPNALGTTQMLCGVRVRYFTPPVFGSFMPLIQR